MSSDGGGGKDGGQLELAAPVDHGIDRASGLPGSNGDSRLVATSSSVVVSTTWTGPLPPPNVLARYNEAIPNGADRILRMAESEQDHLQNLQVVALKNDYILDLVTKLGGLLVIIMMVGTTGALVFLGKFTEAMVTGGATSILGLIGAWMKSHHRQESPALPPAGSPSQAALPAPSAKNSPSKGKSARTPKQQKKKRNRR